MRLKKESKEFIKPSEELRESKKLTFRDIIGGDILTRNFILKQLPFFLFVALLIVVYIANRNGAEKNARILVNTRKEVKELRSRSISTTFKLMDLSKRSEVLKNVKSKGLDLHESFEPPKKIYTDK